MRQPLAQCAKKVAIKSDRTKYLLRPGTALRFHSELVALVGDKTDEDFSLAYLRETLLSKYVDENTLPASELRRLAIVKWLGVERRNAKTNKRLFETDPDFGIGHGHQILRSAAKLIKRVLGSFDKEILLSGSFSGGATTSVKRGPGTLAEKFLGIRDVTPEAWDLLREAILGDEVWALNNSELSQPRLVKGNVLFTVPKTALIDRVACKEPDYNIFGQKAVGDYIRKRLKRKAGIDLNDQQRNKSLARLGSVNRRLATIDLSSASDSLTTALVSLLLPHDWFRVLDSLRCPKTFIDGKSHVNEMFSSMGNGFTFELESLIFWALAQAVTRLCRVTGQISVYGDDIIVPTASAGALIRVLSWVGFTTNPKKTFRKGGFRESCGGHYMDGRDVTPFYLKRPLRDVSDMILVLNQLKSWLIRTGWDWADADQDNHNRFLRFWVRWSLTVPRHLRGGYDLTSRVQLCTLEAPRSRLTRVTLKVDKAEEGLQAGLYLTRLHSSRSNGTARYPDTPFSPIIRSDGTTIGWVRDEVRNATCRPDSPFSSITREGEWVARRVRDLGPIFGLVKPLLSIESERCDLWDLTLVRPSCEGRGET